jgi:hypothetical protein
MWYRHCEEVEAWTGSSPAYLSAEYFGKYKWWLRREFRAQQVIEFKKLFEIVLDLK